MTKPKSQVVVGRDINIGFLKFSDRLLIGEHGEVIMQHRKRYDALEECCGKCISERALLQGCDCDEIATIAAPSAVPQVNATIGLVILTVVFIVTVAAIAVLFKSFITEGF